MFAIDDSASIFCARLMRGTWSIARHGDLARGELVDAARRSAPGRGTRSACRPRGAARPRRASGGRTLSDDVGRPRGRAVDERGARRPRTARRGSWRLAPAPRSTTTCQPALTQRATTFGDAATRRSSGRVSLTIPNFMAGPEPCQTKSERERAGLETWRVDSVEIAGLVDRSRGRRASPARRRTRDRARAASRSPRCRRSTGIARRGFPRSPSPAACRRAPAARSSTRSRRARRRAGVQALRYAGPYPTHGAVSSAAAARFATDGRRGDVHRRTCSRAPRARARRGRRSTSCPRRTRAWTTPHGHVELRDGVERVRHRRRRATTRTAICAARAASDGRHAEIVVRRCAWARVAEFDADGTLVDGPHPIPRVDDATSIGKEFPPRCSMRSPSWSPSSSAARAVPATLPRGHVGRPRRARGARAPRRLRGPRRAVGAARAARHGTARARACRGARPRRNHRMLGSPAAGREARMKNWLLASLLVSSVALADVDEVDNGQDATPSTARRIRPCGVSGNSNTFTLKGTCEIGAGVGQQRTP